MHMSKHFGSSCLLRILLCMSSPSCNVKSMSMRYQSLFGVVMLTPVNQLGIFRWVLARRCNYLASFDMMLHLTRLETRTKESNACASFCFLTIGGVMKMIVGMCAPTANQLIARGLSLSMFIRTRKVVKYACGK